MPKIRETGARRKERLVVGAVLCAVAVTVVVAVLVEITAPHDWFGVQGRVDRIEQVSENQWQITIRFSTSVRVFDYEGTLPPHVTEGRTVMFDCHEDLAGRKITAFSAPPAGSATETCGGTPDRGYVEFYYMLDPVSGGHWWVNANDTNVTISLNGFSGYAEINTDSDRVFFEGIPKTVYVSSSYSFTTSVSRMKFGQYPRGDTYENITFSANTPLGVKTFEYSLLVRCLLPGSPDFGIGDLQ